MVQILHSIKGRARYKVRGLYRSESLKKFLTLKLSEKEGIKNFSINILTGNILVYFNSDNSPHVIASVIKEAVIVYNKTNFSNDRKTLKSSSHKKTGEIKNRKLRRLISHAEKQITEPWHLIESERVLKIFNTDRNYGLSELSARENLKKYGPNILPESVPRSGISIFIDQFKSLPVALLGAAAVISLLTGGLADAIIIMAVVTINSTIGYLTESQAEKTIHSLKSLIRPYALVIRDGIQREVGVEEIVPGDIIVLRPGSFVPADARLLEAHNLSVDESALTGESMPVLKTHEVIKSNGSEPGSHKYVPLADRINMVYRGTLVTGGQGLGVVVATGSFTEIGKIQTLISEVRAPETPMERQLRKISGQLVFIGMAVCGLVFLIGILRGYGLLQMLKTSISLAVAAVPEGLPAVATTTLALGIRKMRRHGVIIRHLEAVETLGSIQTICLDKTGTITFNRMAVVTIFTGMKRLNVVDGSFILSSSTGKVEKDINNSILNAYENDELLRLIHVCTLCNESEVLRQDDKYIVNGTSTENALIYMAISAKVDVIKIRKKFPRLKIYHRSEKRNYMVTLHSIKVSGSKKPEGMIVAIKGSPSEVLSLCNFYMKDGVRIPLNDEERLTIEMENERMACNGLRILGVAYGFIDGDLNNSLLSKLKSEIYPEFLAKEIEFIWLGLVGMADPIRDGVKELINAFHRAGIETIMITGDQSPTAYAIGRELNLSRGTHLEILDSTNLVNIEPEIMKAILKNVHVFSRVSPAHKLQIVKALQSAGKVVAMTGDGINDGPALKAADIGIAMGNTGTDVAREVADVVVEDDRLETIIIAIGHGRAVYNNIRKSLRFLLATNLSEIMVMFSAISAGMGQPLNAMQLLWLNLVSDIAPGLALALEPPEPDILIHPPRKKDDPILKSSDFKRITFESAMLSAGALGAYGYGIARYGLGTRAGSIAFMTLTLGQLLHAISCRSENYSIFDKEKLASNRYLNLALGGSFILQILSMAIPGLRRLLGVVPIGLMDALVVGTGAVIPLMVNESTKKLLANKSNS
ncbi:MAG: cation-transporting P-type ATPase [Thermodesulfovibrionales bacterium]|nr:cation-transporting P-type ATPase [Thermodesulfovibrionales bacterium]